MSPDSSQKGLQEYALVDETFTSKTPEGFTDDDVATLPTNLMASFIGLFDEGRGLGIPWPFLDEAAPFDYAGTQLLIIGGGSNCGTYLKRSISQSSVEDFIVFCITALSIFH
jgi:NADPH:quinone reductase-like Zn-dependent oxidoreductase